MDISTSPELSRRDGIDAFAITLADGRAWGLALPSQRLRPEVVERVDGLGRPSRTIQLASGLCYPLAIRRLIEELRSACDQADPGRHYDALIRLAAALVCRVHDIDMVAARSLLGLDVDGLSGLVEVVLSVVTGASRDDPGPTRKGEVDG